MTTARPTYVPIRVLAQRWHIDRRVVRKWIAAGLLPAVRFPGGICRVLVEDARTFETVHAIRETPRQRAS